MRCQSCAIATTTPISGAITAIRMPTFSVLRALVEAGEELGIPATVGVGVAGDAFYAPRADHSRGELLKQAGVVSVEMESDTLFIAGQYRGWRTGAIYASDGTNQAIKPEDREADFRHGEQNAIRIALEAMLKIAQGD